MDVCVLGSINLDNVCRTARLPVPGETVIAESFEQFPGGKGANQAVAAAAWGAAAILVGAVGRDEAGERLLAHLRERGVEVSAVARLADAPSGLAYICVSATGENTIVVVGGANRAVTRAQVEAVRSASARVLLAQLETPLEAVEALFTAGRAGRQATRILNAAPAEEAARALFPLADIIVVNQSELAFYAGGPEPANEADGLDAARRLISRADQMVIVTLGAAGVVAVTAQEHIIVPGCRAQVVDTTGAGDCFCGVLAAAFAEGRSLPDALSLANLAAALSTEHPGAAAPRALRAEAEARLTARAR
jgi:ribokinase